VSNTNVNASVGRLSNIDSTIDINSNTQSNIFRTTYIKSDLQIVSEILSNVINYRIKNGIVLNGLFDTYNNMNGD